MVRKIGNLKSFIKGITKEITVWEMMRDNGNENWSPKECQKEIERCNKQLNKANEELKTYEDYEESKNVATIIEFFEKWEESQRNWFKEARKNYLEKINEFEQQKQQILNDNDVRWESALNKEEREKYHKINDTEFNFKTEWRNVEEFIVSIRDDKFEEGLNRYIFVTKENLMYDMYRRIYDKIGKIIDTKYLELGMSKFGPVLNGIIKGENGNAIINTITAGGYNIQRFHYRVLVKVVDENGNKVKK